jgi:hypothetical protein
VGDLQYTRTSGFDELLPLVISYSLPRRVLFPSPPCCSIILLPFRRVLPCCDALRIIISRLTFDHHVHNLPILKCTLCIKRSAYIKVHSFRGLTTLADVLACFFLLILHSPLAYYLPFCTLHVPTRII